MVGAARERLLRPSREPSHRTRNEITTLVATEITATTIAVEPSSAIVRRVNVLVTEFVESIAV